MASAGDGAAFLTAFLVDEAAAQRLDEGVAPYPMARLGNGLWATDVRAPEAGTGHDEGAFLALARASGLVAKEIRRGYWSAAAAGWNHQDAIVLQRAL